MQFLIQVDVTRHEQFLVTADTYEDAEQNVRDAFNNGPLIINFIRTPPTFIRTCADECGNPIP